MIMMRNPVEEALETGSCSISVRPENGATVIFPEKPGIHPMVVGRGPTVARAAMAALVGRNTATLLLSVNGNGKK